MLRNDRQDRSDHLLARPAEDGFGNLVPDGDAPVEVDLDDRDRRSVDHGLQALVQLRGLGSDRPCRLFVLALLDRRAEHVAERAQEMDFAVAECPALSRAHAEHSPGMLATRNNHVDGAYDSQLEQGRRRIEACLPRQIGHDNRLVHRQRVAREGVRRRGRVGLAGARQASSRGAHREQPVAANVFENDNAVERQRFHCRLGGFPRESSDVGLDQCALAESSDDLLAVRPGP